MSDISGPNKIITAAVINAEPNGPDAKRTISELMRIFDSPRVLRALPETAG